MTQEFLKKLDIQIQAKHLLNHPFYQAWTKGELSRECLKEYVNKINETSIMRAVDRALQVLWAFLSHLCERYNLYTHACKGQ